MQYLPNKIIFYKFQISNLSRKKEIIVTKKKNSSQNNNIILIKIKMKQRNTKKDFIIFYTQTIGRHSQIHSRVDYVLV